MRRNSSSSLSAPNSCEAERLRHIPKKSLLFNAGFVLTIVSMKGFEAFELAPSVIIEGRGCRNKKEGSIKQQQHSRRLAALVLSSPSRRCLKEYQEFFDFEPLKR